MDGKKEQAEKAVAERRFIDAGLKFYELSLASELNTEEKKEMLQLATTCTVLCPSGIRKGRLLKNIFKDDRAKQLIGYSMVKDMFLERLIKPAEMGVVENSLIGAQKKVGEDGVSLLQNAVIEHNLLALSRIYKTVTFEDVSEFLAISPDKVERTVGQLISSGCIAGSIDQSSRLITFKGAAVEDHWDSYVSSICEQTNLVSEIIGRKHPEWLAEQFRSA